MNQGRPRSRRRCTCPFGLWEDRAAGCVRSRFIGSIGLFGRCFTKVISSRVLLVERIQGQVALSLFLDR